MTDKLIWFSDEVGCANPDYCEQVCENPSGCSNVAYPLLVIRILPTGIRIRIVLSEYQYFQWYINVYVIITHPCI